MTVRLRFADESDISSIMSVMAEAFDLRFGEAWSAAQMLSSMASANSWTRLAVIDGGTPRVAGFSLCRRAGPEAELLLIGVRPTARGGGIGAALLATARVDALRAGVETMFLEVRDGNAPALALYHAGGFSEVGRRFDYYSGNVAERFDAITMRCDLNKSPE